MTNPRTSIANGPEAAPSAALRERSGGAEHHSCQRGESLREDFSRQSGQPAEKSKINLSIS